MTLALIVGAIVIITIAITAAAGYFIDRSAPDDVEELPPAPLGRTASPQGRNRPE